MEFDAILMFLKGLGPVVSYVLMGLGSVLVVASVYVKATPSLADDEKLAELHTKPFIGPLLKALEKFSLFNRKE